MSTLPDEHDAFDAPTRPTATTSTLADVSASSGWDLWLLGGAVALAAYGLLMVLAASSHLSNQIYEVPWRFAAKHLAGLLAGGVAGMVVLTIPWSLVRRASYGVWFVSLMALFAVHTPLGASVKGATRWIDLGPVNVQPSEFAKIGLALALARWLSNNEGHIRDVVGVVLSSAFVLVGAMVFAVYLQSDLGTIALLLGIAAVAYFVAGLEWRWILLGLGVIALGVVALIYGEEYRYARVVSFLDPLGDAQGDGYQVVQGWVAIAVGGVGGSGIGQGVAQQGFLPEAHTDMISAVIAEELGVWGWSLIFLLHGVILYRGLRIAEHARSLYDIILASCITAVLAAQVIINTGVVGGLVPPKGLVLPFLSYGASAVTAHTLMIALLLRVGLETHRTRTAQGG